MADLCRGGGAHPNSAWGAVVSGGSAAIGEWIAKRVTNREMSALLSAILGGVVYNLADVCSRPAPDIPTLTPQDYVDAVSAGNAGAMAAAILKFENWFLGQYWSVLCTCNDGLPPGAPLVTSPPTTTGNPGLPDAAPGAPCWDVVDAKGLGANNPVTSITADILPATQTVTVTPRTTGQNQAQLIPAGVTQIRQRYSVPLVSGIDTGWAYAIECFNASGQYISTPIGFGNVTGVQQDQTIALPPGTASWLGWKNNPNAVPIAYAYQLTMFCSSTGPTVLLEPCCPPDPSVDIKLNQILNLLLSLPQSAGGGYTRSTVHSGLQNSGSLSVSGLAGVEVVVTSGTPTTPLLEGNPPYQWSLGWLSASDGGGMLQEQRLTRAHQIWVPREASTAGTWSYFLRPGVIATITELKAI